MYGRLFLIAALALQFACYAAPAPVASKTDKKWRVDPADRSTFQFSPKSALERTQTAPPAIEQVVLSDEIGFVDEAAGVCQGMRDRVDKAFCFLKMFSLAMTGARRLGLEPVVRELQRRSIVCSHYHPQQIPCMAETMKQLVQFYTDYPTPLRA